VKTSNNLEEEAYKWFLWWFKKCDARSFHWHKFTPALLKRFYEEEYDDLYIKSVHLKQKGNMNDYTHEWEVLETRQSRFTYEQLLNVCVCVCVCVLKDHKYSKLRQWNPKSIEDVGHVAKLIEQKNKFNKSSFTGLERSNRYLNEQ